MKPANFRFIVILAAMLAAVAYPQTSRKAFADKEILLKFDGPVRAEAVSRVNSVFGGRMIEDLGGPGWARFSIPGGIDVERAVEIARGLPGIVSAQPNFYYRLSATPNDTRFSELYGLTNISAPAAWDIATGSAKTVVAVIDTGIRYDHEDLAQNIWTNPGEIGGNGIDDDMNGYVDDIHGYDFFFDDPDPNDEHGHGTHVAGTIGAVGNNALGVVGVNWSVSLMAVKIYDSTGFGTTSAMLINAYNYVRLMRERGVNVRVTNNSYGGCDEACGYDLATKEALEALGDAGVLNVFAAGNGGQNIDSAPFYPGSYTLPTIINTAAATQTDGRAGFSNYGAKAVDIAAPGSGILSTVIFGSGYAQSSGTSMAAPHVSGAAALLSSFDPALSNLSLKATIMNSADRLVSWEGIVKSGGRLNAASALANRTVCSYSLSSGTIKAPTKGGFFTITVSAPENCGYRVTSNDRWIIPMPPNGTEGPGTVTLRVTVNPTISRTGTVEIAGHSVTVSQSRN